MHRLFSTRLRRALLISAVFAAVLAVEAHGIATPSLWDDEIATISASNRSVPHILRLLQNIDAVHGTYYLLMHFWGKIFGFSPFSIRLPSAIAVSLAAVLSWRLARKQFSTRVGLLALFVVALLPRMSWAATEGRSYGLDALVGIATIWLLHQLVIAKGKQALVLWVAYTALAILAIHLFVYIALYLFAQGIWLAIYHRNLMRRWLASFVLAAAASGFIGYEAFLQRKQVHWLPPISGKTFSEVAVGQVFWLAPDVALVASGLILVYVLGRHWRNPLLLQQRQSVVLYCLAIAIPTGVVLGYSVVASPIYDARYFTYSAPLAGILLAAAIDQLFDGWKRWLVLVVVLVLCLAPYSYFRAVDSKLTDWAPLAGRVGQLAQANDCVLFTDFKAPSPSVSRLHIGYPQDFGKLHDLTLKVPFSQSKMLYDVRQPIVSVVPQLSKCKRVFLIGDRHFVSATAFEDAFLTKAGFVPGKQLTFETSWLRIYQAQPIKASKQP